MKCIHDILNMTYLLFRNYVFIKYIYKPVRGGIHNLNIYIREGACKIVCLTNLILSSLSKNINIVFWTH